MEHFKRYVVRGVIEATFSMLSWTFILILFVNKFTDGLVARKFINLDYMLLFVIVFGVILIGLELPSISSGDSIK